MKFIGKEKRDKAKPYPPKVWEQYKDIIVREYHRTGCERTKQYMAENYSFHPTPAQWKNRLYTKWKLSNSHTPPLPDSNTIENLLEEDTSIRPSARPPHFSQEYNATASFTTNDDLIEIFQPIAAPTITSTAFATNLVGDVPLVAEPFAWQLPHCNDYYGHSERQAPLSSVSDSVESRKNSAVSSTQQSGSKRTASVTSQSPAPSLKRLRRMGMSPSSLLIRVGDEGDARCSEPIAGLESESSMATSESRVNHGPDFEGYTTQHRSGSRDQSMNQPTATKEEIMFPCSADMTEQTSNVIINVASSREFTDVCSYVTSITNLRQDLVCRFLMAGELFTACRARPVAFKIQRQLFLSCKESLASLSDTGPSNLILRHAFACARLAESDSELQACVDMLNEQLTGRRCLGVSKQLRLRITLSDVFLKGGKETVADTHRAVACALLERLDTVSNIGQDTGILDLVADLALVRAFAYKAGQQHRSMMRSRCSTGITRQEEERRMREATNRAAAINWRRLSRDREQPIRVLMTWCQRQLRTVSQVHIAFLRKHFIAGSSSPSSSAIKRLHVAAVFGYLSLCKQEPQSLSDRDTVELLRGLDKMTFTSAADVLWILSAVIVEAMEPANITLNLTNTHFDAAYDAVTRLLGMKWEAIADRMLPVMHAELSCTKVSSKHHRHNIIDSPQPNHATDLVSAVIRRDLGVHVQMLSSGAVESARSRQPPPPRQGGPPAAIDISASTTHTDQVLGIGVKNCPNDEPSANDYMLTGESNNSSTWLSMKRIREQAKRHLSWTWRNRAQTISIRSIPDTPDICFATASHISPRDDIAPGMEPMSTVANDESVHESPALRLSSTKRMGQSVQNMVDHLMSWRR